MAKHSFIGRECVLLLDHYADLVHLLFPDDNLSIDAKRQRRRDLSLWESLKSAWEALNHEWEDDDDPNERQMVSDMIYVRGADFMTQLTKANGGQGTFYSHILVAHIPGLILRFGDLRQYSTQAIEHLHKLRK